MCVVGCEVKKITANLQCSGCKQQLVASSGSRQPFYVDPTINAYVEQLYREGSIYLSTIVLPAFQDVIFAIGAI